MSYQENQHLILVIDDDKVSGAVLREVLRDFGTVEYRANGEDGIHAAKELKPDLIILDVNMPDLSGLEVCEELKSDPVTRPIPVLIVTGSDDRADEEKSFYVGAADFVKKPIVPSTLRARTYNIVALQDALRAMERLARTDPLTGAANRRHFFEVAQAAAKRRNRQGGPLSVMMLDIDRFKSINDTYGHAVGDEALKHSVRAIEAGLRAGDLLGRMGGEEFAVLCPDTGMDGILPLAERIREAVAAIRLDTTEGVLQFTVSVGVYTCGAATVSVDEMLKQADTALYRAKHDGRNRIVIAT